MDYSIEPPQPVISAPGNISPKKPMWKLPLLVFIIVALVYGAGLYLYSQIQNVVTKDQNVDSESQSENALNPIDSEIAGWKTYRNEDYGFEFKYPGETVNSLVSPKIGTCFDGSGISATCEIYAEQSIDNYSRDDQSAVLVGDIYITVVNHKLGEKDIHKYDGYPLIGQFVDVTSKTSIGGVDGYIYDLVLSTNYKIRGFIVPLGDKYIEIYENSKSPRVNGWDKIISTFKFTNQPNEMAGWKTYRNDEYGFEIKYPESFFVEENALPVTLLGLRLRDDLNSGISFAQITVQKECIVGELGVSERVMINGINFDRYIINKSGGGIKQVGYSYKQVHDKCYYISVEGFLQDLTLNNEEVHPRWTDQEVQKIQEDFVKIISTFKFTK